MKRRVSSYSFFSSSFGRLLLGLYSSLVLAYLLLPLMVIIPMGFSSGKYLTFPPPGFSVQYVQEVVHSPQWTSAIWNSITVGVAATVLSTLFGTMAAIGLVWGRFRGRLLLFGFFLLPLLVPVVVSATGLYLLFAKLGLLGTFLGMVLAHAMLGAPFVVMVVSATLTGYDRRLINAAFSLGAHPWGAFRTVTLPIIAPGVVSGALLSFMTSFDEVVVALFLSGSDYRTVPVLMFQGIRFELDPSIAAVGTLLLAVSLLAMITAELLRRRARR
ncbi:ABC transporter permease [bacterium]|nr:ABC transporter permease [bacterium]